MSTVQEIADAIVSALNAETWSQPIVAVHSYVPRYQLGELEGDARVTVVARSVELVDASRALAEFTYSYDVAVQKRVDNDGEIDAILELAEEISDFLAEEPLAGYPQAKPSGVRIDPPYSVEHLENYRVVTSVIGVDYKVWR